MILEFFIFRGEEGKKIFIFRKIHIFERNWAPIYCNVRKFHMRRLNLNAKKSFTVVLKFSILSGKFAKFCKIRIFELNGAVNYSMVKKFYMKGLDLSNKKTISVILEFSILNWKIAKF